MWCKIPQDVKDKMDDFALGELASLAAAVSAAIEPLCFYSLGSDTDRQLTDMQDWFEDLEHEVRIEHRRRVRGREITAKGGKNG